jgi:hypothetical protein
MANKIAGFGDPNYFFKVMLNEPIVKIVIGFSRFV